MLCKPKARTPRQRDKMKRSQSEIMAAASLLDFSVQETMLSVDAAYGEEAFIASDWDIYYDDDVEIHAVTASATPHDGEYKINDGFHIMQAASLPETDEVPQTKIRPARECSVVGATPTPPSPADCDPDCLTDAIVDPLKEANCRKMHVCLFAGCNKYYGKSSHLKAHMRAHTGRHVFYAKCFLSENTFSYQMIMKPIHGNSAHELI